MRSPRRLFKATRSRSEERSQFDASSTRGQPRGKVVMVRAYLVKAEPRRGPIKATRSGTVAHGCVAGSSSPTIGCLQHPSLRSSLACLRSAVWLPGTVGVARIPKYYAHQAAAAHPWRSRGTRGVGGRCRCLYNGVVKFRASEEDVMAPTIEELGLDRLSLEDRLAVAEAIWDSVARETEAAPSSAGQLAELNAA